MRLILVFILILCAQGIMYAGTTVVTGRTDYSHPGFSIIVWVISVIIYIKIMRSFPEEDEE